MRNCILLFALLLLALMPAGATVINFDDLVTVNTWGTVPNAWLDVPSSYAGMTFTGWEVMNRSAYNTYYSQSEASLPSDPNFAYSGNDSNNVLRVSSGVPFLFLGTQLANWPNAVGAVGSVTITGWLGSTQVGSVTQNLGAWSNSGGISGAIDRLDFAPSTGVFRMDNLEVAPVPEPASMALLGAGLIALGWVGRRRLNKA